ncbi:glycosyltransferase, partial [Candidatus Bathyarchaeota archaeon]
NILCLYLIDAFPFVLFKIFFSYSISVFAIGGDINLHPGPFHKLIRKIILSNCKNIFSVSSEINTKIYNETGTNTIITPNGVDSLIFRPLNDKLSLRELYDIDKDLFVILSVCNLHKEKGVDLILQSLKILLNNNKKSILLIRGTGPDKDRLLNLVKELGLEEHVFFLENKTMREMVELYNMSDVFILASYSEGLPSTVLESMASGCITIASSVGEVPMVICDGENGFLIEPGDVETIVSKIAYINSMSKDELSVMKDKAREKVLTDYDIKIITKKMYDTLSSN